MDFGINARLAPSDYVGLDMTPIRELKKTQGGEKVHAKNQPDAGTVGRDLPSLEQRAQARERARKKLESAGRTVHQVEDLLHDTISGFRANRAEDRPIAANERLLKSADETAADIVGFARFDEEMLFPPLASPVKFAAKKAVEAYASNKKGYIEARSMPDPPEVATTMKETNESLRGDGGVLPTLGKLANSFLSDLDGTDLSLNGLKNAMRSARASIEKTGSSLKETPATTQLDVAS